MSRARRATRTVVILAVVWAWLHALPLFARIQIARTAGAYHPAEFTVTGAEFAPDNETGSGESWHLVGVVEGRQEHVIPDGVREPIKRAQDLLDQFPQGTKLAVQYNPGATETNFQGEMLRVRHDKGDFWDRERRERNRLLWRALLPLALAVGLHYFVRHRAARAPVGEAEKQEPVTQ